MPPRPFFSIALTTFDRDELLRQTVRSVLAQDFADFELLIGNNNPARPVTPALLGVDDARVRIVNHPEDLGQRGNAMRLLELANGRYFSQLADDDCYAPDFLSASHAGLSSAGFPPVAFSAFELIHGAAEPAVTPRFSGRIERMAGERFLWRYLIGEIEAIGVMGWFEIGFARGERGWPMVREPLTRLFGEYLFFVTAGLLDEVVYFPDPLIYYRVHEEAWGVANRELDLYYACGDALVEDSAALLRDGGYRGDYRLTVLGMANLALRQILAKLGGEADVVDARAVLAGMLARTDLAGDASPVTEAALSWLRQFATAEADRARKESALARLSAMSAEIQASLVEKEQEISRQGDALTDARVSLTEKDEEIGRQAHALAEARASLTEKEGLIVSQAQALAEKDEEIARQAHALEEARASLVEKDKEIDRQGLALAEARLSLAEKDGEAACQAEARSAVLKLLDESRAAAVRLRAEAARAREETLGIRAASKAKDEEMVMLYGVCEERERLIHRLDAHIKVLDPLVNGGVLGLLRAGWRMGRTAWRGVRRLAAGALRGSGRMVGALWPVRAARAALTPGLGVLMQHPPRPLRLPAAYRPRGAARDAPLISIVTPSYNQAEFIERTVRSVLEQGYPRLEYIVQDGGSRDGTVDILERYDSALAHWESAPDEGQTHAINLGFAHATGEIMAYLNSDDVLLPGALQYVADYFAAHPDIDAIYSHRVIIDEADREIGRWILPAHDDDVLSWADFVPQETLFWRRSAWERIGGALDESFHFAMDWDLLLRLRDAGARFARVPRILGAFRVHSQQKTSAAINEVGFAEMDRLRERCHGRAVSGAEIRAALVPYLARHMMYHVWYKLTKH